MNVNMNKNIGKDNFNFLLLNKDANKKNILFLMSSKN